MQKVETKNFDSIISDKKIQIRISFLKSDGIPSIISLWYTLKDGKIYCATQRSAKIIAYLKNNPNCGFEIATDKPPYKGVRGNGMAKIISEDGESVLDILICKYLENRNSKLSQFLKNNAKSEVAIEITPQKIFNYDYTIRMQGA